jgi:hypothetical protein
MHHHEHGEELSGTEFQLHGHRNSVAMDGKALDALEAGVGCVDSGGSPQHLHHLCKPHGADVVGRESHLVHGIDQNLQLLVILNGIWFSNDRNGNEGDVDARKAEATKSRDEAADAERE